MTIKIQSTKLTYFRIIVENKYDLNDIRNKLKQFSEFSGVTPLVEVDFKSIENKVDFISSAISILNEIKQFGFKILAIVTSKELPEPYLELVIKNSHHDSKNNKINDANAIIFNQTKYVNSVVRSGSEVFNIGDVIIQELISHGAEVRATGNIHVYGECRGKLFAGINGDISAKIYVSCFNAELVSIAGVKYIFENEIMPKFKNKAVFIYLNQKKQISILPINV